MVRAWCCIGRCAYALVPSLAMTPEMEEAPGGGADSSAPRKDDGERARESPRKPL